MEDFEKNRIEYVQRLETQIKSLTAMVEDLQTLAQWAPKFGVEVNAGQANITMDIKGKRQTVSVDLKMVQNYSNNDLSVAVIDAFKAGLIEQMYRPVIEQQLVPVKEAANRLVAKPIMGS